MLLNKPVMKTTNKDTFVPVGARIDVNGVVFEVYDNDDPSKLYIQNVTTDERFILTTPRSLGVVVMVTLDDVFVDIPSTVCVYDRGHRTDVYVHEGSLCYNKAEITSHQCPLPAGVQIGKGSHLMCEVYIDGAFHQADVVTTVDTIPNPVGPALILRNKYGMFMTEDLKIFTSVHGMGLIITHIIVA